ncbi:MAG: adenylyltransferase/cytidyltransferase family protein [Nanoarchaeota archaeon]|nr:adenylyltransferase/cytidyltransferase family protein [Nanoarchaeota archaeon]
MNGKIKDNNEIIKVAEKLKKSGKMIITTNGCFDILHYAHVRLLEKAKKEGDILIILLNSDYSIKKVKGLHRPIILEKERAEMLAALECTDYITIFDEDNPLKILKEIKPHIHVKGGSFILEKVKEEKDLLESWGGEFKSFDLEEGFSTTSIIDKITNTYGNKN